MYYRIALWSILAAGVVAANPELNDSTPLTTLTRRSTNSPMTSGAHAAALVRRSPAFWNRSSNPNSEMTGEESTDPANNSSEPSNHPPKFMSAVGLGKVYSQFHDPERKHFIRRWKNKSKPTEDTFQSEPNALNEPSTGPFGSGQQVLGNPLLLATGYTPSPSNEDISGDKDHENLSNIDDNDTTDYGHQSMGGGSSAPRTSGYTYLPTDKEAPQDPGYSISDSTYPNIYLNQKGEPIENGVRMHSETAQDADKNQRAKQWYDGISYIKVKDSEPSDTGENESLSPLINGSRAPADKLAEDDRNYDSDDDDDDGDNDLAPLKNYSDGYNKSPTLLLSPVDNIPGAHQLVGALPLPSQMESSDNNDEAAPTERARKNWWELSTSENN
ncbi:hypothetical protein H4R33_000801 [Dimargaris cristalligena]|nr:hypothetical protein H4R33_000801 [Dimargaris cristalligena]